MKHTTDIQLPIVNPNLEVGTETKICENEQYFTMYLGAIETVK